MTKLLLETIGKSLCSENLLQNKTHILTYQHTAPSFDKDAEGINPKLNIAQRLDDFNGRQPQNIKSGISQQPLVRSVSNSKLKLLGVCSLYNYNIP